MEELNGKHAFITGAASGIGLGLAKAFAAEGMTISIVDLRKSAVETVLPWFAERGFKAQGIVLDVTDRAAYETAVDDAEKGLGQIHLLVNNAGVETVKSPLWECTYDDIDFTIDVNIKGVINGLKTVVPRLLKSSEPAHIMSTASFAGISVVSGATPYCLSKAAVSAMMETVATDLQDTNVGVSTFYPGWVITDLAKNSSLVRPSDLPQKTEEKPRQVPPRPAPEAGEERRIDPEAERGAISVEEVCKCAVRGVKRGDLFIFTNPEFETGLRLKYDAMLRAIPTDATPDQERAYVYKYVARGLIDNPIYETQKQR